jgi:hypothetical protein
MKSILALLVVLAAILVYLSYRDVQCIVESGVTDTGTKRQDIQDGREQGRKTVSGGKAAEKGVASMDDPVARGSAPLEEEQTAGEQNRFSQDEADISSQDHQQPADEPLPADDEPLSADKPQPDGTVRPQPHKALVGGAEVEWEEPVPSQTTGKFGRPPE